MSRKATIIFANCAGSARDENSNPKELGRFIASKLLDTEQFGDIIAVGLSEIILSSDPVLDEIYLNTLTEFEEGFNQVLGIKTKEKLTNIYVKHTGQSYEKLFAAMERDNYMDPQQAKDFGLIDHIIDYRKSAK